jgi:hypothetical protein
MKSRDVLQRRRAFGVLGVAVVGLIIAWTVVLPWVGQQASVRTMIDRNESHGIDPTAMFYTELENMSVQDGTLRRNQSE